LSATSWQRHLYALSITFWGIFTSLSGAGAAASFAGSSAATSLYPGTAATSPSEPVLGCTYRVGLRNGTEFRGVLTALSLDNLEFDTQDLGHLVIARTNLTQLRSLDGPARLGLRPGYYDIGNGNRLFFGPTARNLRQGEGVVQDVWIYLAGINYGITDNISLGATSREYPV
jgi:hypothetical protein